MRDWFFYQERGKTLGPLTGEDLRLRIRDGRIKLFDLIYKEGESSWKMAMEHPDLKAEFKNVNAGLNERPWVALQRKSEESFEYLTVGPYSTKELSEAIQDGRMSYNDYAWREGFKEWTRIGAIEDFNPRAKTPVKASDAPTVMVPISSSATGATQAAAAPPKAPNVPEPTRELLRNVVELKRGAVPPPIPRPSEAAGDDLTKRIDPDATKIIKMPAAPAAVPTSTKDLRKPRISSSAPPPPPPPSAPSPDEVTQPSIDLDRGEGVRAESLPEILLKKVRSKRPRMSSRAWTDWGIVGALIVVFVVGVGMLVRKLGQTPVVVPPNVGQSLETQGGGELAPSPSENAMETLPPLNANAGAPKVGDAADIPPPVESALPAPPSPKAESPSTTSTVASKEPTLLVLNVQPSGSGQARIEIRSNGSPDFPVYLQVVGLPGQVSDGASFFKFMKLKSLGNPNRPLDLTGLKLPQGRFNLRVESGKLHKEASFNLGIGESTFKQASARQRKAQAAAIWLERSSLYKICLTLEASLSQALSSKRVSLRGLDALNKVKRANGGDYIFFEEWWELRQILRDAQEKPTASALERARKVRERVASYSVWRFK